MMTFKIALHPRVALRLATLAALVVVAAIALAASRGGVAPVEAKWAASGQVASSGAPVTVDVRIEAVGTQRDASTGRPRTSNGLPPQSINQASTGYLRAGYSLDPRLCTTQFGETPFADYGVQWKFDTTVLAIGGGRTKLQVHWIRWRAGNPGAENEDARTITLASGETHLLDFVEEPDASAPCANLVVRISAEPILPESTQQVGVELWTVDQSESGTQSVQRQLRGKSGQLISYVLPALDFDGGAIKMEVSGNIVAALGDDGFVDIVLTTTRRSVSGKSSVAGEGRVAFRAKAGETAGVVLPEPRGRLLLSDGATRVDLASVFAGHQTSLYVKVNVGQ